MVLLAFKGQSKVASGNIFFYPELSDQIASFDPFQGCMSSYGTPTFGEVYTGNTCIVHDGSFVYSFNDTNNHPPPNKQCNSDALNKTIAFLANNTFYSPTGEWSVNCQGTPMTLADFQRQGMEIGSTVRETPPVDALIAMAKDLLLL